MSSEPEIGTFDPARRRLCPDGACVGVLDASGACRVCGAVDAEAAGGLAPSAFAGSCASDDMIGATGAEFDAPPSETSVSDGGFDPNRRLCPDGTCVGVIGPQGRCKTCGLPAAGA